MPQVSWYLAGASLSSFQFLSLVRYWLPLFCLIVMLQLFSLILQGTSCISVWHYLQPGVTFYRLHQPACLLKSLFLQLLLDRVKEQATFWQHSTTCCTCLCQTWSHASGYPFWTWLGQNSQNGLIPCQSWKLHTRECWRIISSTSLSATLLHCTNRRNTDFRRVLFLSVSDISRGSTNASLNKSLLRNGAIGLWVWYITRNGSICLATDKKKCSHFPNYCHRHSHSALYCYLLGS